MYLNVAASKDDLKIPVSYWKNIHFGRGANQMIIHFSEASILPSVCSFIHPFLQIHPGAKSALRHGID